MKKNLLLLMAGILVFISCKKGGDGTSNTLMLAEVYKNGLLEVEYIYSTDKKMVRYDEYSVSGNQSNLFLYVLLDYGANGKPAKWKIFTPNDTLNNWYDLYYDAQARVSRSDRWFNSSILSYKLIEYDTQDRYSKITEKNGSTNANIYYTTYTYDDQSRLTAQQRYFWSSNKWNLDLDYTYVPAGKNVYDHFQPYTLSPTDMYRSELNMASKHVVDYDNTGNVTSEYSDSTTNKKYNSSSFLVSQTITRKWIKPVKADEVWEMEYVYVQ
jgi:hypothetical protein